MFNWKREEMTYDKAVKFILNELGDTDSLSLDESAAEFVMGDLAKVDGFGDLLRDMMVKDVRRYFAATSERDRDIIRGGFARAAFIHSEIMKRKKVDNE